MKNSFFDRLRTVKGCTVILDGCKPLKMGEIRKPRFSNCDVEKAMEGFFNKLLDSMLEFGDGPVRFTVRNMRRLRLRSGGTAGLRAPLRLYLVARDGQLVGPQK